MSQNWHGHWVEENYKPSRLGNWEVSNFYPQWPARHSKKTTFQCDNKGHLLAGVKKINSGRDYFKTAWELPRKIDRRMAQELSAPPKRRKQVWEAHKANYRAGKVFGDSSKEEKNLEKIPSQRYSPQREIKPGSAEGQKPEAEAKLEQKLDSEKKFKDLDGKSNSTELSSDLKVLESDTNSESHCTEEKINRMVCNLHRTCKI